MKTDIICLFSCMRFKSYFWYFCKFGKYSQSMDRSYPSLKRLTLKPTTECPRDGVVVLQCHHFETEIKTEKGRRLLKPPRDGGGRTVISERIVPATLATLLQRRGILLSILSLLSLALALISSVRLLPQSHLLFPRSTTIQSH